MKCNGKIHLYDATFAHTVFTGTVSQSRPPFAKHAAGQARTHGLCHIAARSFSLPFKWLTL